MFKSMASILSPTAMAQEKDHSLVKSDDHERSDPAVSSDALPDDHPVHWLPEAQMLYKNGRSPPFVLQKRSEVVKCVVIPTKYGSRPKDEKATIVKIKAKPWDKDFMFWTLDQNGKRYIVKPFAGGAQGGMRYLYWTGPGGHFEQKPLALSFISPSQPGATKSTRGDDIGPDRSGFLPVNRKRSFSSDYSESSGSSYSSDSSDASNPDVQGESARVPGAAQNVADVGPRNLLQQTDENTSDRGDRDAGDMNPSKQPTALQGVPAKRRKTEVSGREINQLYRVSPPVRRRSDAHIPIREHESALAQPTTWSVARPVNDREERRKQSAIARIEKDLDRKFDQIFTPWADEDRDVSRNTLQSILRVIALMEDNSPQKIARTLNKALNGGDGKRQPAGGRKPTQPYFKVLADTLQANKAGTVKGGSTDTPASPSGSNRQHRDRRRLEDIEDIIAELRKPDTRSIPLEGDRHQLDQDLDSDMVASTILPQHKQNRTKLFVRVAPSPEYLPLKLSECTTPRAFYTKVLSAWGIRGEAVAKITATFTWMDPKDKMRTMFMNRHIEGCFAHLLEQVDEAPGWEEGEKGRCVLDVDIVLKK